MSKKRQHHEEHENLERWLVSYADFITLLFATFVVLYAISSVDAKKFERMSSGMKSAFLEGAIGNVPIVVDFGQSEGGGSTGTSSAEWMNAGRSIHKQLSEESSRLRQRVVEALEKSGAREKVGKELEPKVSERGLVISLSERHYFGSGQAELNGDGIEALAAVGKALASSQGPIRVEGHTDDRPISTPRFASNWELSVARSAAVVRFLIERGGIDPERLSAAGYAEFRPVAANDGDEGRGQNRRVDIVVLSAAERAKEARSPHTRRSLAEILEDAPH